MGGTEGSALVVVVRNETVRQNKKSGVGEERLQ